MVRNIAVTTALILAVAACARGHDTEFPAVSGVFAGEPVVTQEEPGLTVIDASGNNGVFPTQPVQLRFGSEIAMSKWAADHLNAKLVYDDNQNIVGAVGLVIQLGDLFEVDGETESVIPVEDPIAHILGGPDGYVTLKGKDYCVNPTRCKVDQRVHLTTLLADAGLDSALDVQIASHAPSSRTECNSANTYCIKGKSWDTNWWVYHSIGSKTSQERGGYRVTHHFCWKWGFIPWSCSKREGSNHLESTAKFFGEPPGTPSTVFVMERFRQCDNCESVKARLWSVFVSISSSGAPGTLCTAECELTGVCGIHFGRGPEGSARATTAKNDHIDDFCLR